MVSKFDVQFESISFCYPLPGFLYPPAEPEVKIVKSGYLTKQGGARGGRKNWKKRYFVLKEDCLFYYSEDKQNLLGVMPVMQSRLYDFAGESRPPPKFISRPFCHECKNKFSFGTRAHHCRCRTQFLFLICFNLTPAGSGTAVNPSMISAPPIQWRFRNLDTMLQLVSLCGLI